MQLQGIFLQAFSLMKSQELNVQILMFDIDDDDNHCNEDSTSGLSKALPLFVTIMVDKSVLSTPFSVPAVY